MFGHEVGVIKKSGEFKGVAAFLLDNSNSVFRLAWPPSMPKKTAKASMPAPWTNEFASSPKSLFAGPGPSPSPSPVSGDAPAPALSPVAAAVAASPPTTSSLDQLDSLILTTPTPAGAAPDASLPDAEASPGPSEEIGEHLASAAADAILPGLGLLMDLANLSAETTPALAAAVGACAAPQQIQVVAPPAAARATRPGEDEEESHEEHLKD